MPTVSRRFEFDYGHRVLNHESKCKNLHGHRGVAVVTVSSPSLDKLGRVIDFGCLKRIVGDWINERWDHNMILHANDSLLGLTTDSGIFPDKKPYVMGNGNPTAENLAEVLYHVSQRLLREHNPNLEVIEVQFFETPNCVAVYPERKSQ